MCCIFFFSSCVHSTEFQMVRKWACRQSASLGFRAAFIFLSSFFVVAFLALHLKGIKRHTQKTHTHLKVETIFWPCVVPHIQFICRWMMVFIFSFFSMKSIWKHIICMCDAFMIIIMVDLMLFSLENHMENITVIKWRVPKKHTRFKPSTKLNQKWAKPKNEKKIKTHLKRRQSIHKTEIMIIIFHYQH